MPSASLEVRLEIYTAEGWTPVIAVDNITKGVIKDLIDKRIFENDVNEELQYETNTCISLSSSDDDQATFEVLGGYASPCLKNKDNRFAIE
jgi:hypothetical protein